MGAPATARIRTAALAVLLGVLAVPSAALADRAQEEIAYLLAAVGQSGCTFVRNGTAHSASDAEAHLRLKYRKGKRYVETADQFIERLASQSSWTRQTYLITCPGHAAQPSGPWLAQLLTDYRTRQAR